MKILVAGGAGYIGSHTCVELISSGYEIVVVDNLANSKKTSIKRVEELTGQSVTFYEADILDRVALNDIFAREQVDAVINFAGLKAVGESVEKPLAYYRNNVAGALTLLEVAAEHGVKNHMFSSSATVYGEPAFVPITEECPVGGTSNPYGQTKLVIERMMMDLYDSDPEFNIVLLRYFNPVGAHESGRIGEDPKGIPNNLMPYISQVAIGKRPHLNVFGNDYPTSDGTGVRDYIHVVDLARGHVAALQKFACGQSEAGAGGVAGAEMASMVEEEAPGGLHIYNLGTGRGYSVLEMLHAFEKACGKELAYEIAPRRDGDIAECYCDPTKAFEELGWKAEKTLEDMCADAWRWQSMNPDGYVE